MTPQQAIDLAHLLLTKLTWQKPMNLKANGGGIKFRYCGRDYFALVEQGEAIVYEQTALHKFDCETLNAVWLTGILNGKKRDDGGRHVA